MMRFAKEYMESIGGVEIFPIISLLIFFTFFVLLFVYVMKKDKRYIDEVSQLPLEGDKTELP
ncbi:MAG: CcoQ/FixQ family Cbb3-type cytochrome c oxidase assembly chaperone [Bacteroidota bacterium]|nr:CcoQ/FixQ family Cbb3-type cytochrome c oxidase assembly chaperone [Bacteroidota bacterium]MDX5404150.1 CcoQ/FixQ family Cbb3-type cytochrome c oxidase assembly chaperone [Bacteroidota bacterium]MDX5428182.1 CcoQ/FixQ family Cbb3-type cytochrome c oxidase assembly chaperone [Bacteroidota bacterium]MDX5447839.1 CcoQ/FixQ family Cbb3-type cytochrome c oxidase assembly chaperone [Bacteroidota bacterium]MDX5505966.1 CcoQ/FixQ family Cbb3-type cytochrome c oxidase assembly chaperone [Bacteroidota